MRCVRNKKHNYVTSINYDMFMYIHMCNNTWKHGIIFIQTWIWAIHVFTNRIHDLETNKTITPNPWIINRIITTIHKEHLIFSSESHRYGSTPRIIGISFQQTQDKIEAWTIQTASIEGACSTLNSLRCDFWIEPVGYSRLLKQFVFWVWFAPWACLNFPLFSPSGIIDRKLNKNRKITWKLMIWKSEFLKEAHSALVLYYTINEIQKDGRVRWKWISLMCRK